MTYGKPAPGLFDLLLHARPPTVVPNADGEPDVAGLPSDLIQTDGQDYMRRYFLLGGPTIPGATARYHQILRSDGAHLHDHPWDFVSVILKGRYIETTPAGDTEYVAGCVLPRPAEALHRLALPDGPVWTFVITSSARRAWGFATDDGWVPWRTYTGQRPSPPVW